MYLKASATGMARGIIGLPVEHPLEFLRTRMQAAPKNASVTNVIKDTYNSSGIKGFYAGLGPNCATVVTKVSYRCPLMVILPEAYKKTSL